MNDKHYNPIIAVRLHTLVDGRQWDSIPTYLGTLSHSLFRTAGYMLGERYMPSLKSEDFWSLSFILVSYHSKAFLSTVLKCWISRPSESLVSTSAQSFFKSLRGKPEDQKRAMLILLPVLKTVDEVVWLQESLGITDPRSLLAYYLQAVTFPTSFLLLQVLHRLEDDRSLLIRTAYYLMKRGDGLSFNLASLIRNFFDLEEVKGTFSLDVQPYELSRLTTSYDAFCKTLRFV